MKILRKISGPVRSILAAVLALASAGIANAGNFFDNNVGGIDLGTAAGGSSDNNSTHRNWAIFALTGGVTITDPTYNDPMSPGGYYDVLGNIGMAGSGTLNLTNASINGSVWNGSGTPVTGNPHITSANWSSGGPAVTGAYLTSAANAAISASSAATGMTMSSPGQPPSGSSITLSGGGMQTLTASPGSLTVVNLQDLILTGLNTALTLTGSAGQNFVINVSRYMTLSSSAQIKLSGGLTVNNVLFNVTNATGNAYDVTLSGGSVVNGIILAPNRNVKLTGASVVNGEVIAKGVSLSGRSRVLNPFVSP